MEYFKLYKMVNLFVEAFPVSLWDVVRYGFLGDGAFLYFDVDWGGGPVLGFSFEKLCFSFEDVE